MFGDAWRTMKYRFYDPKMHGMDWDAAKAKYEPLVRDVGDRQELLAILVQREYEVWVPRGTEASGRPFAGYFGPKVVLQNWRSASNAEMFPAGFRALGLGKVIGTPTMGAVIGTGSYSLIDGSTVRTPGVGVYLADVKHTNMENYGVQPDIRVDNSPEENLAGRDRQLETAVEELMKQLGGPRRNIATKENQ